MCLIVFAYQVHPMYKLIVAANRDEDYERPTAPLHYWEDHPNILAGRDLKKMGTWMGVDRTGRFAAVTNYRDSTEMIKDKRSRGELVVDFLNWEGRPEDFIQIISENRKLYPGYNLVMGDATGLFYYSNMQGKPQKLKPGIYGISNHLLDTDWPKVKHGKQIMSEIIGEKNEMMADQLLTLLHNADQSPATDLPDTGVPLEWEKILSAVFIKSERYGTRSSSVVFISEKEILYNERTYSEEGLSDKKCSISF